VHGQFYEELLMATNKESGRTIADCFITIKEKFLIYGEYCSNLLTAQELLDHVCNTMPPVQKRVTVRFFVCRVTTCLQNLEVSGNLTAVREMSGILLKVREMSRKKSCHGKVA